MCKNDVEKVFNDPIGELGNIVGEVANAGVQATTGGFVGFDAQNGTLKEGVTTNAIKDVTGATAAEEANKMAAKQFDDAKKTALKAQQEAKARTARDQMSASRLAASSRKSGAGRTSSNKSSNGGGGALAATNSKLGTDEQDFLGL